MVNVRLLELDRLRAMHARNVFLAEVQNEQIDILRAVNIIRNEALLFLQGIQAVTLNLQMNHLFTVL